MGDCFNDINDAFASGMLSFPVTSEEEWEKRREEETLREEEELIEYKKVLENTHQYYQKGSTYYDACYVVEVKSYHEVVVKRNYDNKVEVIPMYYFYKVKLLNMQ